MEPARPAQAHTEVFAKNLIEPAPPKKIEQKLGSANSTQSIFPNFGWSQFNPNGFSPQCVLGRFNPMFFPSHMRIELAQIRIFLQNSF